MVEERIERLSGLCLNELKSEWRRVHKGAPPVAFTADLLLRGISYRLQEQAFGKLPIEHRRELDRICSGAPKGRSRAQRPTGALRPGSRLVRRWRGITFSVAVVEDGFLYNDDKYRSLSEIARVITGARWSGPRFFGCVS